MHFIVGDLVKFTRAVYSTGYPKWAEGDLAVVLRIRFVDIELFVKVERLSDGLVDEMFAQRFVKQFESLPEPKKTSYDADF